MASIGAETGLGSIGTVRMTRSTPELNLAPRMAKYGQRGSGAIRHSLAPSGDSLHLQILVNRV